MYLAALPVLRDSVLDVPLAVPSISMALSMWLCMCVAGYSSIVAPDTNVSTPVQSSIVIWDDDLDKHTLPGSLLDVFLLQVCVCVCHHGSNRLSANIQDHFTAGSVLNLCIWKLNSSSQLWTVPALHAFCALFVTKHALSVWQPHVGLPYTCICHDAPVTA